MTAGLVALAEAVRAVREGGLVAFPTETVWGLGADARSPEAVAALRRWKGREADKPISVLVSGPGALRALGFAAPAFAARLAERFWPGPLTLVLAAPQGAFAPGIARADGAVALRCSSHPVAAGLAHALERADAGPLTATSLNRSGEPAATTVEEALRLCRAWPGPRVVDPGPEGPVSCAAPSTVVDCTGPAPEVIREGAIPAASLVAPASRGRAGARAVETTPEPDAEAGEGIPR